MISKDMFYDVIVIGASAAGIMTAITSRQAGLEVLLLDGQKQVGAKILMSGGTRCNVTNVRVTENDFESENIRTVKNVLQAFPSERAVEFFQSLGVELIPEEGGKFFPSTHSARTVLDALSNEVKRLGIPLETSRKVSRLAFGGKIFQVAGENFDYRAKTVALCTGGLSYPTTGSNGTGYSLAKAFGHNLIFTTPSLTPLETDDADWKSLMGVSLPVRLTLWVDQKKYTAFEDSFLFTHLGFSGPCALNMSRHWLRLKDSHAVKLTANFLPGETEECLREDLARAASKNPTGWIKRFLFQKLPGRFVDVLLKKSGIGQEAILNQLDKRARERLIQTLLYFPLSVTGVLGYKKAEATAGGLDLKEIDFRTMESKLQPGLFFAGEILDVDGRIGGFNFQWAWASGFVAGKGMIKKLKG